VLFVLNWDECPCLRNINIAAVEKIYTWSVVKKLDKKHVFVLIPAAAIFAILLFVGGPDASTLRSFRYLWGMGHLFSFALWTYFYTNWRTQTTFKRQLLEVLLLVFIVGGLVELIQGQIGREASWIDLGNDLIGGLAGVVFFSSVKNTLPFWNLKCLQLGVLLLIFWSFSPVAKVVIDDVIAREQFPLLSGFETPLEVSRWSGSARRKVVNDIHFSGTSALQIQLSTHLYSGLGLKDFPRDWSAYRFVSLQVFNPDSEPLKLHFRIHDRYHYEHDNAYSDRFNTSFILSPGWNHLQVPLDKVAHAPKTRRLDLTHVAGMGVFIGKLPQKRIIYLDDVRLIP